MLGRDVQRQFAARAHLLALQARTKRTVTPDDEKLNHCIALLRTNSFENQERGIKFMTRLAKQGCQVFVYYDGRSSLRDVIERTQNDDFSDYYTSGLKPDYEKAENFKGELGELGTAQDSLMIPIIKHIETGSFPTTETPDAASRSLDEKLRFNNSIDLKPKSAIIE